MKSRVVYLVLVLPMAIYFLTPVGRRVSLVSPAAAAAPMNPVPAGVVNGTVKFVGQPPKPAPINMAQEPSCAKAHPVALTSGEVVAGADNTLGNVIVYISSGLEEKTYEPPSQPAVIDQKGCMYSPHVLAIQANQKLQVVNSDPTMHNIHPIPTSNREWNKSQPPSTPPIEASFAREEIAIPVKCNVHPWMRSYIAVFKHPYFAVTGKEGNFELKNVPPGNYTISAWHEKFGTLEQKVTVGPGEAKKLEIVFKARSY